MEATKRTGWLASIVLIMAACLLLGLLGRVVWIQKHITPEQAERLARQYTAEIPLMPERGAILLADGTPAALSVRMYNLFADPGYIVDPNGNLNSLKDEDLQKAKEMLAEALAPLVKKPKEDLLFEIEKNATYPNGKPRRFLWLAKEVDEDFYEKFVDLKKQMKEESHDTDRAASKIKDSKKREEEQARARVLFHTMDGVGFAKSMKRVYPMGQLGGNVIGFANTYEGVDGMEHQLDFLLRGLPGKMYVTKDAARHTLLIQDQRYTGADDGRDVWLTMNTVMQGIVEDELKKAIETYGAEGGTAILMDPFTGKILAMSNCPFFDPADIAGSLPESHRNKAVTDPFEPGSIFKPFVMAWAIEKHIIKPTDVFDCRAGRYVDPTGRVVTDTHAVGMATAAEILVESSNIGMTQIGWKMGIPNLYEGIRTFGFGDRTGVELPGDQKGIVHPLSQWNKGTLTSASFGYEVAATPLQLLRAFCTFANGGYLITPRVINAVEESSGKTIPWSELAGSPLQKQIISEKTCETMRNIMVGVFGPHGTAKTAGSKVYQLYGKTGTAYVAGKARGDGMTGHGYGEKDYNGSFLCGGPLSNPRLVAIVTLHKPDPHKGHFGGTVAAPAATAIVERALQYLQIPSDMPDGPETGKNGTKLVAAR